MPRKYKISVEKLKEFCIKVLKKGKLPAEHAAIVADTLVQADLRGVNSHGLIRFPFYMQRIIDGGTKARPKFYLERETVATAVFNGDNGMGQVVTYKAMELAIKKAEQAGIGFVVINNSNHFGAAAYYAMQVLAHDMVGLVWSNGPKVMAPWGGSARIIGNNPIAWAIPAQENEPIVFDISMSKVAGGKVRLAAKQGKRIPEDWIISKYGKITDDPNDLPDGGALMALGHKGYGLAVVGEVLAGALSGAGLITQIPMWFKETALPTNIGHMVMALNVEAFMGIERFKGRVDYIINVLKKSRLADGYDEILIPGELESRTAKKQLKTGVSVMGTVLDELDKIARDFRVAPLKRR